MDEVLGPHCGFLGCGERGRATLRLEISLPPDGEQVVVLGHEACFARVRDGRVEHDASRANAHCVFCGESIPIIGKEPFFLDVDLSPPGRFWVHAECIADCLSVQLGDPPSPEIPTFATADLAPPGSPEIPTLSIDDLAPLPEIEPDVLGVDTPIAEGLRLRPLKPSDSDTLDDHAHALEEQAAGRRWVCVAEWSGQVAGHVSLLWEAHDSVLGAEGIPEIYDLKVFPLFRRRGIGSALLDELEAYASTRSKRVGLNVGLHSGYGPAQRLYVRRGYVPDGSGAVIEGVTVPEGATIRFDDQPIVTLRMKKSLS